MSFSLSTIERLSIMASLLSLPDKERTEKDKCLLSLFHLQRKERLPWDYGVFLLLAAKHGNPFAAFLLGECLRLGLPPFKKDSTKAYRFLLLSHEGGYRRASVRLLSFRNLPKGLRRTISRQALIPGKDVHTLECLSKHYRFINQVDKEKECLEKLLATGMKKHLLRLLDILLFGPRKTRDIQRAIVLLEEAKKEGRKDIFYYLGRIHLEGKGVKKDIAKAKISLIKDKRNPKSLLLLGKMQQHEGRTEKAKSCYRMALSLGENKALPLLAILEAKSENPVERRHGFLSLRRLSVTDNSLFFPLCLAYGKRRNGLLSELYLRKALLAKDRKAIHFALKYKRRMSDAKKALWELGNAKTKGGIRRRLEQEGKEEEEGRQMAFLMFTRLKRNLSIP